MIDVSRLALGDRCPHCRECRVYAVDLERNLWLCVPNAMPVPWLREHMLEHAADEFDNAEDKARSAAFSQLLARGELRMIPMMNVPILVTQHIDGAAHGR